MEDTSWGWTAAIVAGNITTLAALWIRGRWRAQAEKTRAESIVTIAEAKPDGGRLRDQRADGSSITMSVPVAVHLGGRRG